MEQCFNSISEPSSSSAIAPPSHVSARKLLHINFASRLQCKSLTSFIENYESMSLKKMTSFLCNTQEVFLSHYEVLENFIVRKIITKQTDTTCNMSSVVGMYVWFESDSQWIFVNRPVESLPHDIEFESHRSHTPSTNFKNIINREVIIEQWSKFISSLSDLWVRQNHGTVQSDSDACTSSNPDPCSHHTEEMDDSDDCSIFHSTQPKRIHMQDIACTIVDSPLSHEHKSKRSSIRRRALKVVNKLSEKVTHTL